MYLNIFISLVSIAIAYQFGRFRDDNKKIFDKKLEIYSKIVTEISNHSYPFYKDINECQNALLKLFSPARLIGGTEVVDELREYFSLVSEYFDCNNEIKEDLISKISDSAMELEQRMRKDLGRKRHLSKLELFLHRKANSR